MTPAQIAARARKIRTRIDPYIRTTPLELLTLPGAPNPVYAKCEHLQVTGSFKVRGALSRLMALTDSEHKGGVVTASTGNHGAAVAYGAHHLGVAATVFVPEAAPAAKLANMERWSAAIERVPGDPVEAERHAPSVAEASGRTYVSPYNDDEVVCGQATVGIELAAHLDSIIVAVGGGGLISGTAAAVKTRWPQARVIGCAAANTKVMLESVRAGRQLDLPSLPSLSDGTAGGIEESAITFPLCQALVDDWIEIEEDQIASALIGYLATHHQLIEGSAAMAVAVAAWHALVARGDRLGTTVVVTCGANIDPQVVRDLLST